MEVTILVEGRAIECPLYDAIHHYLSGVPSSSFSVSEIATALCVDRGEVQVILADMLSQDVVGFLLGQTIDGEFSTTYHLQ